MWLAHTRRLTPLASGRAGAAAGAAGVRADVLVRAHPLAVVHHVGGDQGVPGGGGGDGQRLGQEPRRHRRRRHGRARVEHPGAP
eukprot:629722-Prorocentrum_minimum.AAC.1